MSHHQAYLEAKVIEHENEIKKLQEKLRDQKVIVKNLKWRSKHPYFNVFNEVLSLPGLPDICLSYLSEKFCEACEEIYSGSVCINCTRLLDSPCVYQLQSDMNYLHTHKLPENRGNLYCFQPTHIDDIILVKQWNNKKLKDAGNSKHRSYICPGLMDSPHEITILSTHHYTIFWTKDSQSSVPRNVLKGKILSLFLTGSTFCESYYSIH